MTRLSDSYVLTKLLAPPTRRRSVSMRSFGNGGMLDPYRPESHYMRGPGPKWHKKHAGVTIAAVAGAP
jgi:hypothetical protein